MQSGLIQIISGGSEPMKQVEFGEIPVTTANYQEIIVNFASAFPSIPFVTLSPNGKEDLIDWKARLVTTSGFTLEGYNSSANNAYAGVVAWKAEEK